MGIVRDDLSFDSKRERKYLAEMKISRGVAATVVAYVREYLERDHHSGGDRNIHEDCFHVG